MSIFDKIAATVMPPESDEQRTEARRKADAMVQGGDDWLGQALDHHRQIESLFRQARSASDGSSRKAACKQLGTILTAHANAEETVLYPMLAEDHKGHAAMAYQEQAMVKIEMHKLEMLEPMSQEWLDKIDHIQGAVTHHMYEEESGWFGEVREAMRSYDETMHSSRFREEFEKNAGSSSSGSSSQPLQMAAQMDEDIGQPGELADTAWSGATNFTRTSREDAAGGSASAGVMCEFGHSDEIGDVNQRSGGNDY